MKLVDVDLFSFGLNYTLLEQELDRYSLTLVKR